MYNVDAFFMQKYSYFLESLKSIYLIACLKSGLKVT